MRNNIKLKTIGDRLRQIRKEFGLTQHMFAKAIGISQGYLSEIESDKTTPGRPVFIAVECRFSVNIDWLFTGEEPKYLDEKKEYNWKTTKAGLKLSSHDTDLLEIMAVLQKDSEAKKAVLKLLRGKKEIAEALAMLQDPPELPLL